MKFCQFFARFIFTFVRHIVNYNMLTIASGFFTCSRALAKLVQPGGWVDTCMTVGAVGLMNIIKTK